MRKTCGLITPLLVVSLCLVARPLASQSVKAPIRQPFDNLDLNQTDSSDILSAVISRLQENALARRNLTLTPDALRRELVASRLDMGAGVENGLALQGTNNLCSPTGNCLVWFFQKVRGKWQILRLTVPVPENEPDAASFQFVPPAHDGLYDLVLQRHMSAEGPMTVWRFDGKNYEFLKN